MQIHFIVGIRNRFRNRAPEWALLVFRKIRNRMRIVFFTPNNWLRARKFRKMILVRFPELKKSSNEGLVIDLGANVGNFAHACRLLGFDVIAVEPHPEAIAYLAKRFKNDYAVKILPLAVGKNESQTLLHLHWDHEKDSIRTSISASTIIDKFRYAHVTTWVRKVPLAEVIKSVGQIAIMKIDIEGAEYEIVPELINSGNRVERVLMETHSRFMKSSRYANEYEEQIEHLERYISSNHLQGYWLMNWV